MSDVMMACGHAANGIIQPSGEPVCAVCFGDPNSRVVVVTPPDLTGRTMRCSYAWRPEHKETHPGGGSEKGRTFQSSRPSGTGGAFFKHQPEKAEDSFYCGCWGWD